VFTLFCFLKSKGGKRALVWRMGKVFRAKRGGKKKKEKKSFFLGSPPPPHSMSECGLKLVDVNPF